MAPAPRLPKGSNDWRYKTRTGSTVQGSPQRAGQRPPTVAEEVARKAKERADRNQKKPAPKDNPAGPRKSIPGQAQDDKEWDQSLQPGGRSPRNPQPKNPVPKPKPSGVKGLTLRVPSGKGPYVPPKPKGGPGPGRTIHDPEAGKLVMKSQPGPGAPTGGAGRDTPGAGKERGIFEKERQGRMQGSGGDRPPIYKPKDDGERGGYIGRSSKAPVIPAGKPIPKKKPGINTGGPVAGLTRMVP